MSTDLATLRITEIFYSLQGESTFVGLPTVFIRLTGCPLRCGYCDTTYAFKGGNLLSLDEILENVRRYPVKHICVTGGEPLAQPNCLPLLSRLCDEGYTVSLETSGALSIRDLDSRVVCVMDLKTPDSTESEKNDWTNIDLLKQKDEVKFVICSKEDYQWAKSIVEEYELPERCTVLFSPAQGLVKPAELADWILADQLSVRFQLQLHKILWNDSPGR